MVTPPSLLQFCNFSQFEGEGLELSVAAAQWGWNLYFWNVRNRWNSWLIVSRLLCGSSCLWWQWSPQRREIGDTHLKIQISSNWGSTWGLNVAGPLADCLTWWSRPGIWAVQAEGGAWQMSPESSRRHQQTQPGCHLLLITQTGGDSGGVIKGLVNVLMDVKL